MTTVHTVAPHAAKPSAGAKGAAQEGDAAAGDLFAALVAALMPQIQHVVDATGAGTAGESGDGTADAAATVEGAGQATTATVPVTVDVDLTDAAAIAEGTDGPKVQGLLTAIAAHKPDSPAMPMLEGLALRRSSGATDTAATGTDHATTTTTTTTAAPADTTATAPAVSDPLAAAAPVVPVDTSAATDGEDADDDKATTETAPITAAKDAAPATAKRPATPIDAADTDRADDVVAHPVHVEARHHVDPSEIVSDSKPIAATTPHQQLASVITPLRQRPDGTYHLALRLHPEHLGAVDVDVELHQGVVEVHVHAHQAEARELLVTHIEELRAELEQAGLRAGTLDVSDRGQQRDSSAQQGRATRSPVSPNPIAAGPAIPSVTERPARVTAAAGAVDVDL